MKRIIVYCRESRDDNGLDFARIETQRDILLRFVAEKKIPGEIEVILDDNVSGTDFSRLEGIARRAQSGEISTLVFKDASRLGRNLRESLNFLHRMEDCGVEVLFESETYDPDIFPLLAWFNERRAGEDSRKVRHVLRHLMQSGELVIKAPYGYSKSAGKLTPDQLAAGIVRRIFSMYLAGKTTGEVAAALNDENIPTPSAHPGRESIRRAESWNRQHIRRILSEQAYTGDMCYAKTEKQSFKNKKINHKPPDEWIIIPNHHEPIITREDFSQAKKIAARNVRKRNNTEKPAFAGLLYCGGCGSRMVRRGGQNRTVGYVCAAYRRGGRKVCRSHYIREDDLFAVMKEIIEPVQSEPDFAAKVKTKIRSNGSDTTAAKKQIEAYERALARIYGDMLERPEQVPREIYEKKLEEYSARLSAAKAALATAGGGDVDDSALGDFLHSSLYCRREIIQRVFERVVIFMPENVGGEKRGGLQITIVGNK